MGSSQTGGTSPVLAGRYLGGLLPTSTARIFGAIDVPMQAPLFARAVELGRQVAFALGTNGRFATHLEFFDTGDDPVVVEVCARAPRTMVSEMVRIVSGHNLEAGHL